MMGQQAGSLHEFGDQELLRAVYERYVTLFGEQEPVWNVNQLVAHMRAMYRYPSQMTDDDLREAVEVSKGESIRYSGQWTAKSEAETVARRIAALGLRATVIMSPFLTGIYGLEIMDDGHGYQVGNMRQVRHALGKLGYQLPETETR